MTIETATTPFAELARTRTLTGNEKLRWFAQLSREKKELETSLKAVQADMNGLQESLQEFMADGGIQNQKLDGTTVYLHREIWARAADGDTPRAVAVMKAHEETAGFVTETFNVQTVSGWARECERDGIEIPADIAAVLTISPKVEVRARNS